MMKKLEGKIAVVTGGSSGIGLAASKRFVEEGAYVFITGRHQSELNEALKQIGKDNVTAVQSDVSNQTDVDRLYATVKGRKGRIDILFANAGINELATLETITEEHFDKMFDINVKGVLLTVQKALPLFHDGGSVIITASTVSTKGFPGFSVYAAGKAALRSFARSWSIELKDRKIRVNVVSPGLVNTPMWENVPGLSDKQMEQFGVQYSSTTPLGRPGTPDEIAKAVEFLASDDSSYATGIELTIDGGWAQI